MIIITVTPTTFAAELIGAPAALGTGLGFTVYLNGSDTVEEARATTAIENPANSGHYYATVASPQVIGAYVIVWDWVDPFSHESVTASEDVIVTAAGEALTPGSGGWDPTNPPGNEPYYAQATDLDAYIGAQDYLPTYEAKVALLVQAENDLDDYTAAQQTRNLTGHSYTPWDSTIMNPSQVLDLTEACCAQAKYRLVMGTEFFEEARGSTITGPDYTASHIPRLAPVAKRALIRHGIVRITARARAT